MKIVYLFRHSIPDKNSLLRNEYIPLSQDGKENTKYLINKIHIKVPNLNLKF